MIPARIPYPAKPGQPMSLKDSAKEGAQSRSAELPSQPESASSGPALKRVDSLPARLPSQTPQRAEVKPICHPISRALPADKKPPKIFGKGRSKIFGRLFGCTIKSEETKTLEAASAKKKAMQKEGYFMMEFMKNSLKKDPEYKEIAGGKEEEQQLDTLLNHPRFLAEYAKVRNEKLAIPNYPTGTRTMGREEQLFLTHAFECIKEDVRKNPFHIHGETGMLGNTSCRVTQFNYSPIKECITFYTPESRYDLHTHPAFDEPFTSSASGQDHSEAASRYLKHNPKVDTYVTNGRDVMQIMPTSTELIKLVPDPKVEEEVGKFPVAFKVPAPQRPPYPYSNHEAPAAVKAWNPRPDQAAQHARRAPPFQDPGIEAYFELSPNVFRKWREG